MKKTAIILSFLIFICTFSACKKGSAEDITTTAYTENTYPTEFVSQAQEQDTTQQTVQTTENQIATQPQTKPVQTQAQSTTEKAKVVTYISENPDNYYICKVADKYGSDKANLIAFIKTNASTKGATVLEFSGARDTNGALITTAEELRYVYDVPDSGKIKRASSDGRHNDGYSSMSAKAAIMLGEKFFIPSIPEMREQRRYEDYF